MSRKYLGLLIGILLVLLISTACAGGPVGGMKSREIPKAEEQQPEELPEGDTGPMRKRSGAISEMTGPTACVTGEKYTWTLQDGTETAGTNWYGLMMTVVDGTYESNAADVMYAPQRARGKTIEYTFYYPGEYWVFADIYSSEEAEGILRTVYLQVIVTDGGENEVTRAVRAAVNECATADEYETVLALHDWILDHCVYDSSQTWYSGESLFLRGTGVCNTYTRAFKLLLDEAGIQSRRVSGNAKGGGHAWNAVKINGEWYLTDATWDDQTGEYFRHQYFAVNNELMGIEHTPRHYSDGTSWPECTSLDENWFVHGDKWREYARALLTDYTAEMETGWHRFTLNSPVYYSDEYNKKMLGTVTAYAMSRTEWAYSEGKTCYGTFTYDYETGKITGRHIASGTLELPRGLESIEAGSFSNTNANIVIIRDNCRSIGPGAFAGMDIWELEVGSDRMTIDPDAFDDLDFVYVIANPDSSIAGYAREHGWVVEGDND